MLWYMVPFERVSRYNSALTPLISTIAEAATDMLPAFKSESKYILGETCHLRKLMQSLAWAVRMAEAM
jgi:hypothetical protein